VLFNQVFMILGLFMLLLCTILGDHISNNHSTHLYFHAHYLKFTWLDFRVKHVRTYISYIVVPMFLLHIWTCRFL